MNETVADSLMQNVRNYQRDEVWVLLIENWTERHMIKTCK